MVRLELALLAGVSLMPFSTALIGEHGKLLAMLPMVLMPTRARVNDGECLQLAGMFRSKPKWPTHANA